MFKRKKKEPPKRGIIGDKSTSDEESKASSEKEGNSDADADDELEGAGKKKGRNKDKGKDDNNKSKKQGKKKKAGLLRRKKEESSSEDEEFDPFAIPVENTALKKGRMQKYFNDRREKQERERVAEEDEAARRADAQRRADETAQMAWEERRAWDVLELPERNRRRLVARARRAGDERAARARRREEEEQAAKEDGLTYRHGIAESARRWKPSDALMTTYTGHTSHVYSLRMAGDGAHLLTCGGDETARVWDLAERTCLLVLKGHVRAVRDGDFSPLFNPKRPDELGENNLIVTGSQDKTLRVYRWPEKESIHVLYGHKDSVLGVSFAPDGLRAVSCSADATLRMWDAVEGHCLYRYFFAGRPRAPPAPAPPPPGAAAAVAAAAAAAAGGEGAGGRRLPLKESVQCCRFSPSGRYVVAGTGYAERAVRLWYGGMPVLRDPSEIAMRIKWHPSGLVKKIQLKQRYTNDFLTEPYEEYSPDEYINESDEEKEEKKEEEEDPFGLMSEEEKEKKRKENAKQREEDCKSCQVPDRADFYGCALNLCDVDRNGQLENITQYIPGVVFTVILNSIEHPFTMFTISAVTKKGEFSVYKAESGDRCGIFVQTSVPPGVQLSDKRRIATSVDGQRKTEVRLRWRAPPARTGPVVFKANLRVPREGLPPRPVQLRVTLKEGQPAYGNALDRAKRKRRMVKPRVDIMMRHALFQDFLEAGDLESLAMMADPLLKVEDLDAQTVFGREEALAALAKRIYAGAIFKKVNKVGMIETANKVLRELQPLRTKEQEERELSRTAGEPSASADIEASASGVSALTEGGGAEGAPAPPPATVRGAGGAAGGGEGKGEGAEEEAKAKAEPKAEAEQKSKEEELVDKLLSKAFNTDQYPNLARAELKAVAQLRKAGLACAEEVRSIYVPSGLTMPTQHFGAFKKLPKSADAMMDEMEEQSVALPSSLAPSKIRGGGHVAAIVGGGGGREGARAPLEELWFELFEGGFFGAADLPHLRMPLPETYPAEATHPIHFARPALEKEAVLRMLRERRRQHKEAQREQRAPRRGANEVVGEMVAEMKHRNRKVLLGALERRDAFPEAPAVGPGARLRDDPLLRGRPRRPAGPGPPPGGGEGAGGGGVDDDPATSAAAAAAAEHPLPLPLPPAAGGKGGGKGGGKDNAMVKKLPPMEAMASPRQDDKAEIPYQNKDGAKSEVQEQEVKKDKENLDKGQEDKDGQNVSHGLTLFGGKKQLPRAARRGALGILPGFEGRPNRRGWIDKDAEIAEYDGGLVRTFNGGRVCHADSVQSVVFSADESRVASGSADGIVKLWDPGLGVYIKSLEGHTGSVEGLAFSGDGVFLASASGDMTIVLWEVERGMAVQTLRGHTDIVHGVLWADRDNFLFSCSSDATVKSWCVTPSVPLPPERPDARAVSRSEAVVAWRRAPAFNTPFTAFRVGWRRGIRGKFRFEVSVNGTDLERKISNLDSSCAYQFRVCAVNRMGQGEWSEPSVKVVTHLDVPEAPDRPEVIESTETMLKMLFFVKRPTIPEAKISHFSIQISGEGKGFGQGEEREYPYRTCREDAEAYLKRAAERRTMDRRARARFKRPGWALMLADWDGLRPGQAYRFRAAAANRLGEGPPSLPSVTAPTRPRAPDQPKPPTVEEVTSTTMKVKWEPPEENGLPIMRYRVRMCAEDAEALVLPKYDLWRLWEGLRPGTEYSFQMQAENMAGWSPYSDPSMPVFTDTGRPDPPDAPKVGLLTPVRAVLRVRQPCNNGKPVRHYKLQRREYTFGQRLWGHDQICKVEDPDAKSVKLLFEDLVPDSFFSFRVCAMNMHGPSEYSSPSRWIRTPKADVPGAPTNLQLEKIKSSKKGISRCTLRWSPPPADGGAPVTAYLAELCAKTSNLQPDPSEWDQETVEEPDSDDEEGEKIRSWCVLEGLPDGIKYKFRVAACNIVGWGVMSDVLLLEKESNQGEDEGQSGDGSDEDGDDEEENSNDTSSGEEESSESSSGEQQSAGNNID